MLGIIAASCLLLAGTVVAQAPAACTNGLQFCLNTYMDNVIKHAQYPDLICEDINEFVKCVLNLECGMSASDKQTVIDQTKTELETRGIRCDIDLSATRSPYTMAPRPTDRSDVCLSGISRCLQNYINTVMGKAGDPGHEGEFCDDIRGYMRCMYNVDACDIDSVRQQVDAQVEKELREKGIDCDLGNGQITIHGSWHFGAFIVLLGALLKTLLTTF